LNLIQQRLPYSLVERLGLLRLRWRSWAWLCNQVSEVLSKLIFPLLLVLFCSLSLQNDCRIRRLSADFFDLVESPPDLIRPGPAHDFIPDLVVLAFNHDGPVAIRVEHLRRLGLHLLQLLQLVASRCLVFVT
jgi:hypothetical protein